MEEGGLALRSFLHRRGSGGLFKDLFTDFAPEFKSMVRFC